MSAIRIKAVERFAKLIECNIKALKGKICAGPGGRDHRLKFPSLALIPQRFTYEPMQADCHDYVRDAAIDGGPTKEVYNVGRWTGFFEIRLGTKTASQRYKLEHEIEQLFLGGASFTDKEYPLPAWDECLRPGVITIDVPECHGARIFLELLDGSWENELAFSKEWYSVLRVRVVLPALVSKKAGPTLQSMNLKITNDLDTVVEEDVSVVVTEETTIDENLT